MNFSSNFWYFIRNEKKSILEKTKLIFKNVILKKLQQHLKSISDV